MGIPARLGVTPDEQETHGDGEGAEADRFQLIREYVWCPQSRRDMDLIRTLPKMNPYYVLAALLK